MTLPDYSQLEAGTPVEWSTSGDKLLTLTSKADGVGREGEKSSSLIDGTKGMPELLEFRLESAVGASATNGKELECWIGESNSATAGTNNPANLTGADADLSAPDELKYQCNWAGSLVFSNTRGTNVQRQRFVYYPTHPYIIPLIVNKTGQTLSSTAGNHKLVMTPFYRKVID